MRFFSSSARAMAPKLMLAASCSAAEAMVLPLREARRCPGHATAASRATAGRRQITSDVGRRSCLRNGPDDRDRAARLLDRRARRLRRPGNLEGQLRGEFADAKDLHPVARLRQHPGRDERFDGDRRILAELSGVHRLLDATEIDLVQIARVRRGEAALRQAPMQRHLAAFEALDRHAGARLLALDAAPGGLALAGADAPSDAHAVL